ncbi:L-serine ammonia-lyase, iron-sulfur-dependent, subunit alpha [Lentisphaerota bacterium ZTH]|nr:serine dehydratase subunit alpha family protein [Lentisphaerota bacterium]WET06293.1 L-serine ammonia-lyase, iron-sulfur-dependent, subunit alpha [Lentisphaerota bacterium ZTH]
MENKWPEYIELIKTEVVPALGCTEPVSLALAAATAAKEIGADRIIDQIDAKVSGNLMKNGMGVGVPGTGMKGLPVAAAAGALGGNPDALLEVLKSLTPETVQAAKKMLDEERVSVTVKDVPHVLYVECTLFSGEDHVTVIIEDEHTNITKIEKNGEVIFSAETGNPEHAGHAEYLHHLAKCTRVEEIWNFAMSAPLEMIEFIEMAAELNEKITDAGLKNDYGLKIGRTMQSNIDKGVLHEDLMTAVMRNSSAASDARMDGCELPVMANSGSGNQGIAATVPVVTTAQLVKADRETLLRALILSHFTAIHIKAHLDRLSALCAVIVAAMGSSVGIVYLLGGSLQQAEYAIENMIGDVAGIICDGAKASCSLKVSSSVSAAVKAALLAIENIRVTQEQGIVENDVEKVINNLGKLACEGMKNTDSTILKIMTSKSK